MTGLEDLSFLASGIEDSRILLSFVNGLLDHFKGSGDAISLVKDLVVKAREGYVELSDETFAALGIQKLATEDNVMTFVEKGLRKSGETNFKKGLETVGILFHSFDKKLSSQYALHIFEGPGVDLSKHMRAIDVRRRYFKAPEVTILRYDPSSLDRSTESAKLERVFKKVGANLTYVRLGKNKSEKRVLLKHAPLTPNDKIGVWLEFEADQKRCRHALPEGSKGKTGPLRREKLDNGKQALDNRGER